jgi:hypothetical protein
VIDESDSPFFQQRNAACIDERINLVWNGDRKVEKGENKTTEFCNDVDDDALECTDLIVLSKEICRHGELTLVKSSARAG